MVTFVELYIGYHFQDAGEALDGSCMQCDAVAHAAEAMRGIFEGDAADGPVNFIALVNQQLGDTGSRPGR